MTLAMKYTIDFKQGPFTVEQIKAEGAGGADALLFMSMNFPDDGSASHAVYGYDGRTGGDVSPEDMGRAWAHLTHQIATMPGVPAHVAQVARDAHNTIRLLVTAKRQDDNAPKN